MGSLIDFEIGRRRIKTLLEIMTNEADTSAKIIVIGVGGAGNNAVNRMMMRISQVLSLSGSIQISRHFPFARHRH